MWTESYRPQSLDEVVGNSSQISDLHEWANTWDSHREAVVLHGPPGVGKTTAAHALAKEMDWEIMEMNASDKRTGSIVDKIAGESSKTMSLTGKRRKMLILDEADNLHGNSDRGGAGAITRTIKDSEQPIVLVANDFYELSRGLRNNAQDIEFEYLNNSDIVDALAKICKERNVKYTKEVLRKIARNADGDLRGAINDLQKVAVGRDSIKDADIEDVDRDQSEEIFPFLDKLLKEGDPEDVQSVSRDLDMTPRDMFRWIEDNLHREYKDAGEFRKGTAALSKADIWLGRTRATQNYRFWRYASDQLTAGVASARDYDHGGWTRWQPPRYRSGGGPSDELLSNIASKAGCSRHTVRREILPRMSAMIPYCKPRELAVAMAAWYEMDAEELAYVSGSGEDTNKVQGIIEDAEDLRRKIEDTEDEDDGEPDKDEQESDETKKQEETETSTSDEEVEEDTQEDKDESESVEDVEEDTQEDDEQTGLSDFV